MADMDTEDWVNFFKEAGIPPDIAATYAITFNHNRIQLDMLLDLNREILREMGITLMGDVIAILRHAKNVHEQTAREKILLSKAQGLPTARQPIRAFRSRSPSPSVEVVPVVPTVGVPLKKQNTVQRIIGHYTRTSGQDELTTMKAGRKTNAVPVSPSAQRVKPAVIQNSVSPVVPKKRTILNEQTVEQEGTLISRKKARQVLPEHEGGYKITMPSGSTPRSRRILSSASLRQALQKKRHNVFERLGESSVSSTSETVLLSPTAAPDKTKITVTGLGKKIIKTSEVDKSQASVFSRLGEKTLVTSLTPASSSLQEHVQMDVQLPYAGILKQDTIPKKKKIIVIKSKKSNTMRADQECQTSQGAAKSRLGITPFKKNSTRMKTVGILATSLNSVKTNVKARLGSTDSKSQLTPITQQKRVIKTEPQQVLDEDININISGCGTREVKQEEFMRRKSVHFGSVQYLGKNQTNKGSSQRTVITNSSDKEAMVSIYEEEHIQLKEKPTLYVKNSPLFEEFASSVENLNFKTRSFSRVINVIKRVEAESKEINSYQPDGNDTSDLTSPQSNKLKINEINDKKVLDQKNENIPTKGRNRPKDFYLQWALRRAQHVARANMLPEDLFEPRCQDGELQSKN